MREGQQVARRATRDIETWLRGLKQTVALRNVEQDPAYQRRDIDLVWTTHKGEYQVEIKGDRWHRTGNFFLETHSNQEKGTPGCLLYTEADLLFYYFVEPRRLFMIPMPALRDWFDRHRTRFPERSVHTPVASGHYTTVGRIVPIVVIQAEVPGVIEQFLAQSD